MRASLLMWIVCGLYASRSRTGFMNELTFVGQLSFSVRSFCLHLGFCPPLVATICALCACSTHSCCCCSSCNLKLNIDLNNVLCIVLRRAVYCRLLSLPLRGKVQRLWGLRLCDLGDSCYLCRKVTFEVHVSLSTFKLKFFRARIVVVVGFMCSLSRLSKVV